MHDRTATPKPLVGALPELKGYGRDLRIDACRGIVLWCIFLDHVPNNIGSWLTLRNYGFSDAAEVFMFVSGVTCALAYGKALRFEGWTGVIRRTLRRSWDIYVAFLLLTLACAILVQWITRSTIRNASDHLLTGLLFDDAKHRMVPTHATKAGIRYRYYVSLPHLHGESKTASVGSVSRIPAADIEDIIVKSLNEHLISQREKPTSSLAHVRDSNVALEQVAGIEVCKDRLTVRFKSRDADDTS